MSLLAVASPHNTRCGGRPLRAPNSHRSPDRVTGAVGASGTSSSSVYSPATSCSANRSANSWSSKPKQTEVKALVL